MKIINKPIKVMAIFNADGKIEPVKFWYEDMTIRVEKVMKTYIEKLYGKTNIIFVCLHNGKDIYELKYEVDSNTWYMHKK